MGDFDTETRRIYPTACTSAFCGGFGPDCAGCRHKARLEEFKAWVARTGAVVADPIWSPLVYVAEVNRAA